MVTEHTIAYRAQGAIAGEYTTEDMAAGDTVFGDHETLIARVPSLMASTQKAINDNQHPYDVLLGELATDDNTTSSLGRVMIFRRSYQIRLEPSKCF